MILFRGDRKGRWVTRASLRAGCIDRAGHGAVLCLIVALSVTPSGAALAQNSGDVNAGQFDFSLPGARSLGTGGAFVALADDATAAYSNPAGLVLLSRPEISVEGRNWNFPTSIIDRGHGFGPPSGNGIDTIAGLVERGFESQTSGLSFLSFVWPRGNWSFGVFRHEFPSFENAEESQGPFVTCSGGFRTQPDFGPPFCASDAREDGVNRIAPRRQQIELSLASVGGSVGVRLPKGLALGVSLLYYSFELNSTNKVFNARGDLKYEPPDFSDPENLELFGTQTGDDNAFAVNAGVLWQPTPTWSIGGAFRQGPRFTFRAVSNRGPAHPSGRPGVGVDVPDNPFKVPDTFAAGVGYRPIPQLIVTFQYDFVQFSDLIEDFRRTSVPSLQEAQAVEDNLRISDAHRPRAGLEYFRLLSGGHVLSFRAGVWYDPEHIATFEADPETGFPSPRWAVFFPPGDGATHFTAGAGFTLQPYFQIDAAFDISDQRDTYSLSGLWRF